MSYVPLGVTLIIICTFIFSIVATNPSAGVRKGQYHGPKAFASEGENERSRHQHLFQENVRKTRKTKVCGFWKWGFWSCLCTGKVLAPHAPVIRDGNLWSSVQNMTSKLCIFPFYVYYLFPFLYFFTFLGSTRVLPMLLCILGWVRWGNQTYVVFAYQVILFI